MGVESNKRIKVWLKTSGKCLYCGIDTSLTREEGKSLFNTDHIVPPSLAGENIIENLAPSCDACNSAKGTRTLEEFRFYRWQRQIEEKYGARFTQKQERALRKMGFEFPVPPHVFWFEKQDMEIIESYELIQERCKEYRAELERERGEFWAE